MIIFYNVVRILNLWDDKIEKVKCFFSCENISLNLKEFKLFLNDVKFEEFLEFFLGEC